MAWQLNAEYNYSNCREKQVEKIILETISPLKEAIPLYKKYDFKEIAPIK